MHKIRTDIVPINVTNRELIILSFDKKHQNF